MSRRGGRLERGSPLNVVAYMSTPRHDGEPSVPEQQAAIYDHVARLGSQVVETVIDTARGTARSLPPGMRSLLSGLRLGTIDAVIATNLSRMANSQTDLFVVWATFKTTGARLILTSEGIDTANEEMRLALDRITEVVVADQLTKRVESERSKALAGDVKRTSRRVYGLDPTWTEVVEPEAAILSEAAGRVLAGEPLRQIVDDLNRRRVPSPTARGPWTAASLRALLVNPRLWGWRSYYGEPLAPGSWPAIIDERSGERLIRLLRGRRQRHHAEASPPLLTGLARCGSCGATMGVRRGSVARYECPHPPHGCGEVGVSASHLEEFVRDSVFREIASGSRVDRHAARCRAEFGDETKAATRLAEVYRERAALAARIAGGEISADAARASASSLDLEKSRVDHALGYLRLASFTPQQRQGQRMAEVLRDLTPSRSGSLVRLLLDAVVVSPTTRARGFDTDRIHLLWSEATDPGQDSGPLRSIAR